MSQSLDSVPLNTANDFKFLACVLGDKLRNPNIEANKRQIFIKTLLEHIASNCSAKSYERIQKSINQIGHQKDLDQKQLKAKLKEKSNIKQKNLVSLKDKGYAKETDIQDYESQQDDYDEDEYDDYSKYEK